MNFALIGLFSLKIPKNIKNSPTKLLVPGNAILANVKIKKNTEKIGIANTIPPKYLIIRVWYLSYKQPTHKNKAPETTPWLNIKNILPCTPSKFKSNKQIYSKFIFTIELY
jgi:hypothetical protein